MVLIIEALTVSIGVEFPVKQSDIRGQESQWQKEMSLIVAHVTQSVTKSINCNNGASLAHT
jgi:hypothetical protein